PAAEGRGYRLQVGAVRTAEAAKQEWTRLKRLHGEVLGSLGFSTERVDLGARGVFYRIQAGPIANAAAAERDCSELKQRGVSCILVKP
ncbi:MAG TPA: SPOR domain-containing protein, partial [Stellaceae bacterium]|nr:SPOR domain-containing protein [Stellaceae bacterium]